MLGVARRVGVVSRSHSVGVPNLAVGAVDDDFTATLVSDDLLRAALGLGLGRVMGARSL
jgi:hypothetical protein